jgi:thiol-disulfide isomerase/thioredoxin
MFWCLCFIFACNKADKAEVVIVGQGFGRNIDRVYLVEAHKFEVLIDSAVCKDGKFKLKYDRAGFEPFLASIMYLDTNGKKGSIFVRSKFEIEEDGKNHSSSAFMLDYGTTTLEYHNTIKLNNNNGLNESGQVNIHAGREEDLFLKYEHKNIGYMPKTGPTRKRRFDKLIELIDDNSYSFYLLSSVMRYKLQYSKGELIEILNHFDSDVQESTLAKKLQNHIVNARNAGENTRHLSLQSNLGTNKYDINRSANVNMLIFWASWCGPCRMEIPQLKSIKKNFKDKGFYMASISIDKSQSDWSTALSQEKMDWDQFIVNEKEKEAIQAEYSFDAIPLVVFTNKEGKVLAKFLGYDLRHVDDYIRVIKENLNK